MNYRYVLILGCALIGASSVPFVADGAQQEEINRGKKQWASLLLQAVEKILYKEAQHLLGQLPKILEKLEQKFGQRLEQKDENKGFDCSASEISAAILEVQKQIQAAQNSECLSQCREALRSCLKEPNLDDSIAIALKDEVLLRSLFESWSLCLAALAGEKVFNEFKNTYYSSM